MLYTFSKSHYSSNELSSLLQNLSENDVLLFWLDGVLLPLKYPKLFNKIDNIQVALDLDLKARNITDLLQQKSPQIKIISIDDVVEITTKYFPQVAY